jgi:hypothetical protein
MSHISKLHHGIDKKSAFVASLFTLFFLLLSGTLLSQNRVDGRVYDSSNKQVLAFVSVVNMSNGRGVSTDIDGVYSLVASPGDDLRFSFVGYEAQVIRVESAVLPDVFLVPSTIQVATALVENDDNPALRIMEKVIERRNINNPEKGTAFTYKTYNKLVLTAAIDSALLARPEEIQDLDSSSQELIAFFEDKYLFLTESVTERSFVPPDRSNERVLASRVSGLEAADFTLLASQLQSFSFYQKEVSILGNVYLSPIAPVAPKEYVYTLADTLITGRDSIFLISFQPSVNSGAGGLKGLLHINSGDYALRNVIAEPTKEVGGMEIEVRQRYEQIEGGKWFPVQLNSLIQFNNIIVENAKVLGVGRSYITEISLQPELKKRDLSYATVEVDLQDNQEAILQEFRQGYPDPKDANTYAFIDSVGKAENFDRLPKILTALATGRLPIGKFNLQLMRILAANDFEGIRLGAGVETNDEISKWWQMDAYGAYGFKDRLFKGGVGMNFRGDRTKERVFRIEANSDVMERGGYGFFNAQVFDATSTYKFFTRYMDRREQIQASFTTRLPFWLKMRSYVAKEMVQTTGDYTFDQFINDNVVLRWDEFDYWRAGITLRFAFREQIAVSKNRVISFAKPYPTLLVNVEKAWSDGIIDDWRVHAQAEYSHTFARRGKTSLRLTGAYVFDAVPDFRAFNLRGTGVNWGLGVPFSMETLAPQSVLASQLFLTQIRHRFKNNRPADKTFRPELALILNAAWYELPRPMIETDLRYNQSTYNYQEVGMEIHRLLSLNFTSLGIGFYSPLLEPDSWDVESDLFIKISSVFEL